jgi:hypothetical protein
LQLDWQGRFESGLGRVATGNVVRGSRSTRGLQLGLHFGQNRGNFWSGAGAMRCQRRMAGGIVRRSVAAFLRRARCACLCCAERRAKRRDKHREQSDHRDNPEGKRGHANRVFAGHNDPFTLSRQSRLVNVTVLSRFAHRTKKFATTGRNTEEKPRRTRKEVVGLGRFELPTYGLGNRRSIHLSYSPGFRKHSNTEMLAADFVRLDR